MISKSRGAIAFIAALGLASPTFAQYGATGGGGPGYNAHNTTNYHLKRHHGVKGRVSMKPHSWVKLKKKKSSQ